MADARSKGPRRVWRIHTLPWLVKKLGATAEKHGFKHSSLAQAFIEYAYSVYESIEESERDKWLERLATEAKGVDKDTRSLIYPKASTAADPSTASIGSVLYP